MKALIDIQSKLKAPKNQFNSFGKYAYRSCEDILEAVKPLLVEHNATLTLSDTVHAIGEVPYLMVTATLTDESGASKTVSACAGIDVNKKGMDVAQCFGSSSSYARKYALNGLFLIDDTKDADSQDNSQQAAPARKPQQQNKPAPQQEQSERPAPVNQVIDKINKVLVPDALNKTEAYIKSQPYSQKDKEVLLGALNSRRQLLTAQA